jgi:hypothetical protein
VPQSGIAGDCLQPRRTARSLNGTSRADAGADTQDALQRRRATGNRKTNASFADFVDVDGGTSLENRRMTVSQRIKIGQISRRR